MRVCFWTRGKWESTQAVRARELGRVLTAEGIDVSFILDDIAENRDCGSGVRVYRVRVGNLATLRRDVLKAIREEEPAFVHILNPSPKHWACLVGVRGIRLIADWEDCHPVARGFPMDMIGVFMEHWALRRAARVCCVSVALQERLKRKGRKDTALIPYGPLPRSFPYGSSPFACPTVVWMGSFSRKEELRFLVEVAAFLEQRGWQGALELIGDGIYWKTIRSECAKRGLTRLTLTGYLDWDEMLRRLKHAHALLLPLADSADNRMRCPFKAFQYAQAKRPIIATRVGEVPRILGEKAFYAEFDVPDFARRIEAVTTSAGAMQVEYDLQAYQWEHHGRRLAELLVGAGPAVR